MPIKDALEMLIKIFHGNGTQLMKDAPCFDSIVGVRIASIARGHQQPVGLLTVLMEFGRVVMAISQDKTDFGGNFSQQSGSRFTIGDISWGQQSSDGKPDPCHDGDDVQFPAVDPAVPTRFGPVGFGINRGVGNLALLAMLLMPHASSGSQDGTVDGHRTSTGEPGLDQVEQMPPQTANLGW